MVTKLKQIKAILSKYKRKSERLDLGLPVFYSLAPYNKWVGPLTIDNISSGGLKFKVKKKIKHNTKIHLKINIINKTEPIIVQAKVIWCKEVVDDKQSKQPNYIIGIKFIKMKDKDRRIFVNYLCEEILFNSLSYDGQIR